MISCVLNARSVPVRSDCCCSFRRGSPESSLCVRRSAFWFAASTRSGGSVAASRPAVQALAQASRTRRYAGSFNSSASWPLLQPFRWRSSNRSRSGSNTSATVLRVLGGSRCVNRSASFQWTRSPRLRPASCNQSVCSWCGYFNGLIRGRHSSGDTFADSCGDAASCREPRDVRSSVRDAAALCSLSSQTGRSSSFVTAWRRGKCHPEFCPFSAILGLLSLFALAKGRSAFRLQRAVWYSLTSVAL